MKLRYFIILICFSLTVTAQQWQSYNNRIPAWPQEINTTSAKTFLESLTVLKQEIQDKIPDLTSKYENMSQAEAMKLAQQYQKNVMNLSPEIITTGLFTTSFIQLNDKDCDIRLILLEDNLHKA